MMRFRNDDSDTKCWTLECNIQPLVCLFELFNFWELNIFVLYACVIGLYWAGVSSEYAHVKSIVPAFYFLICQEMGRLADLSVVLICPE